MVIIKKVLCLEDGYEDLERCPDCNSDKISVFETHDRVIEKNLKTGKIIKEYTENQCTYTVLRCRSCGWTSCGETI